MTNEKETEQLAPQEKQTKKQLLWEMFRFALVGGVSTVVDYFIFWLFDAVLAPLVFPTDVKAWATFALVLATAFGFCVGLIVNWLLSLKFVFRAVKNKEEAQSKKAFMLFTIIGLFGLLWTELGVLTLVATLPEFALFGTTLFLGTTWAKWLSKVIMTVLVMIWNYVGRKLFIFK